jgi:hypothetical protein
MDLRKISAGVYRQLGRRVEMREPRAICSYALVTILCDQKALGRNFTYLLTSFLVTPH